MKPIHVIYTALQAVVVFSVCFILADCSTKRRSVTTATQLAVESTGAVTSSDSTGMVVDVRETRRDSVATTTGVDGSLRIERDTAGRPVLYIWSSKIKAGSTTNIDTSKTETAAGRSQSFAVEYKGTAAVNVEKEKETVASGGTGQLIGLIMVVAGAAMFTLSLISIWHKK